MEIITKEQQEAEAALHELKEMQRAADDRDAHYLNTAIHAVQEKLGIEVKPGDTYYLITDGDIEERVCRLVHADDEYACNVFGTKEAAEFEVMRRRVMERIGRFAQPFGGLCQYEMAYDEVTDTIIPKKRDKNEVRARDIGFKTEDDVYACILSAGESNLRKYFFRHGT